MIFDIPFHSQKYPSFHIKSYGHSIYDCNRSIVCVYTHMYTHRSTCSKVEFFLELDFISIFNFFEYVLIDLF